MNEPCNREACALRLERLAASAKILADQLRLRNNSIWYNDAKGAAGQIRADAEYVYKSVASDGAWEAGDR